MQHTSVSPDRRLIAIVGDHVDGLLVDSQSGKVKISKIRIWKRVTYFFVPSLYLSSPSYFFH